MRRRRFITAAGLGLLGACADQYGDPDDPVTPDSSTSTAAPKTDESPDEGESLVPTRRKVFLASVGEAPFALGVASGDPRQTSVVLWTRLSGPSGEPVTANDTSVTWTVAADPAMSDVLQEGQVLASAANGHSVHVLIEDLAPDQTVYYRFEAIGALSPTGRTWTLPDVSVNRPVRLAAFCCQQYEEGWFSAFAGLQEDQPDLVVHVGDYIYTRAGSSNAGRTQPLAHPTDLQAFRVLWAAYRLDRDLQRAHAAFPWVSVWDDNEIAGNHAGRMTGPKGEAAYRAWWEHQPTAASLPDPQSDFVVHQLLELGGVARLWMLDTRQYRSTQVCDPIESLPAMARCDAVDDPGRTLLGDAQEAWLANGIDRTDGRWDLMAQQTVFVDMAISITGETGINNDQWDGYAAGRKRLLGNLNGHERAAIISGDIHAAMINNINSGQTTVTEVVAPSVTTAMSSSLAVGLTLALAGRGDIEMFQPLEHGYVIIDIDADELTARFRWADPLNSASVVRTGPSFGRQAGTSMSRSR
jgi:alkaline phosphatase D